MRIDIVNFRDWSALYVEGRLEVEGTNIRVEDFWDALRTRAYDETRIRDLRVKFHCAGDADCDLVEDRGCAWTALEDFVDQDGLK